MTDTLPIDAPKAKARILIVDDHPVVREGLMLYLRRQPDLEVCAEADSAHTALQAAARTRPDLAIVDLSLQGASGLELIKDLRARHRDLRILVLSMLDESLYAERALRAGARGYIMKHEAAEKVLDAVRQVLAGRVFLSPFVASRLLGVLVEGKGLEPSAFPVERLTDRELEIFEKIGRGLSTRQIAADLHLSVKTVETHRAGIKNKLGLDTAAELLQHAILWLQDHEGA